MQSGEWKIARIYITNGTSEDDALSIHHGSEEVQVENGSFGCHFADMSFSGFNVTGVSKKADNKAPTIVKKSLKVSKTKVKKNKKSTFSVQVKDIYGNTAYYSLSNPTYKKKYKKAYSKVTIYRK